MKNSRILNIICVLILSLDIIIGVSLSVLGNKTRIGYLTNFDLNLYSTLELNNINIKEAESLFTTENILNEKELTNYVLTNDLITNYNYNFRISYYNKVFKNSDIYNVYIDINKVLENNDFIKKIKIDKLGSPFGVIESSVKLEYDKKIEDVSYNLKLKNIIIIFIIISFIIILSICLIYKYNFSLKKKCFYLFFILILLLFLILIFYNSNKIGYIYNVKLNTIETAFLNNIADNDFFVTNNLNTYNEKRTYMFNSPLITNYLYSFKIYSDEFEKYPYIYSIHPNFEKIKSKHKFIKEIKVYDKGSPYYAFITDNKLDQDTLINDIDYNLKINIRIIYYLLILILVLISIYLFVYKKEFAVKNKYIIYFVIVSIVLFSNFYFNMFSFAKEKLFNNDNEEWANGYYPVINSFGYPDVWSENDIFESLNNKLILNNNIFMYFYGGDINREYTFNKNKYDYQCITDSVKNGEYFQYISHLGLHTHMLFPLFKVLYDKNYSSYYIYQKLQLFVSILSTIAIGIFFTFLALEFGILPVSIMFVFTLFTNIWITIFAKDLWWMPWSFFLPFLVSSFFIYKYNFEKHNLIFFILFAIVMAMRFSMGYEFISTVMVSSVLPLFYFAISRFYSKKKFIKYFLIISGLCFLSLLIILFIQMIASGGIEIIINRLYSRTIRATYDGTNEIIDLSFINMLKLYLLNNFRSYNYIYPIILLISIPIVRIILAYFNKDIIGFNINFKKYIALLIISILSFLGVISNLFILRQHAYIHVHVGYITFWIPCLYLIYLMILFRTGLNKELICNFIKKIKNIKKV